MDSQWTHDGHTKDSQRTHTGFTPKSSKSIGFTELSANKVVFYIGFMLGCPRTMLFSQCFVLKVVRETLCFYIGFKTVVREQPCKTYVNNIFRGQPTRHGFAGEEQEEQQKSLTRALAARSNRLSLAHTASPRPLARTTRTETEIDFPVGVTKDSHPQPQIYIYIYIYMHMYCIQYKNTYII